MGSPDPARTESEEEGETRGRGRWGTVAYLVDAGGGGHVGMCPKLSNRGDQMVITTIGV
jgi:hypothetical protein